jgi:hypothetical protein
MDYTPTCPPWWPQLLWELHVHPRPRADVDPINYSPVIEDIMASIHVHTMSRLMTDQGAAAQIRTLAEHRLTHAAENLGTYQTEATLQSSSGLPAVPSVQTPRIDQATISQMRALAAARPSPPAAYKGIDEATISQMRALAAAHSSPPAAYNAPNAGAHPSPPAAYNAPSAHLRKGIDEATISQMRALAAARPSPPAAYNAPSADLRKGIDEATISQMRALAAAHSSPRHRIHQRQ